MKVTLSWTTTGKVRQSLTHDITMKGEPHHLLTGQTLTFERQYEKSAPEPAPEKKTTKKKATKKVVAKPVKVTERLTGTVDAVEHDTTSGRVVVHLVKVRPARSTEG